jgi:hypothetical protein
MAAHKRGESMNNYIDHWLGMPEFIQEKMVPFHIETIFIGKQKLIIRIDNEADLADYRRKVSDIPYGIINIEIFADAIGQKLTNKTKSIWHPFKSHWGGIKKEYIRES